MARKTIVTLIDDLDGKAIEEGKGETVKFSLDSTSYEIDLSDGNAKAFRDAFKEYTKAGRSVSGSTARRSSSGSSGASVRNTPQDLSAARTWLRLNGHQVSDRGRIPNKLMELFQNAG